MIRAVPNDNNTIVDSQKRIVIVSNKVETTAKRCYSPNHYRQYS